MNEEQYLQVCEACDRVLMSPDASLETIAIPWLHVIRPHPSFLKDYKDLFGERGQATLKKRVRYQLGWVRQLWKALRSNGHPWFGPQVFQQSADILFISHLLNPSQAGINNDPFFGDLPQRLQAKGRNIVVALIDHTGQGRATLSESWHASDIPHVIFPGSLGLREEWSIYRRLKKEASRLKQSSKIQKTELLRRVFARASMDASAGGARTTLRMYHQVSELVGRVKPKVVVVTYEGHAWERVAFTAARVAHPHVVCAGYQHAAIFRLQHGACRNLRPEFNPDHLFAAGPVSKEQLAASPRLHGIPVTVLGSGRAGVSIDGPVPGDRFRTCLVIPEGIGRECKFLFEFSLDCARVLPNMNFIWRLHPLLDFQELAAGNKNFRDLPGNILLSERSLNEDVAKAGYALYRGSTAIVSAVCGGARPIYLQCGDEMTIDPLYQLKSRRTCINSTADFLAVVQSAVSSAEAESQMLFKKYCADFYSTINSSAIEALLSERCSSSLRPIQDH